MKLLMLDAGPDPTSTTAVALREIRIQLDKEGIESEVLYIGNDPNQCNILCHDRPRQWTHHPVRTLLSADGIGGPCG